MVCIGAVIVVQRSCRLIPNRGATLWQPVGTEAVLYVGIDVGIDVTGLPA